MPEMILSQQAHPLVPLLFPLKGGMARAE